MATTEDLDFAMPFNGDSTVGTPGLVGPYSAESHSLVWRGGLGHLNNFDNRGPVRDTFNEWQIAAVGGALQATIDTGAAFVRGVYGQIATSKTLDIPPNNTGNNRLDRIVIRRNGAAAVNELELAVKTGTAAAYAPLTQSALDDGVFEIPLWKWTTPNAAGDLTAVTFIDERNWSNLPYVLASLLTNNTGNDLIVGTVVVQDTGATKAFTTTTTETDTDVIGVIVGGEMASGTAGRIAHAGVVTIRVTGAVAIGNGLCASTTAGVAIACNLYDDGCFARALSAAAGPGAGTVEALLLLPASLTISAAGRRGSGLAIASGAWRNVTLEVEDHDTDGMLTPVSQRITVPAGGTGLYDISYLLYFQGASATLFYGRVFQNGITSLLESVGSDQTRAASGTYSLTAGDTLDLQGQVNINDVVNAAYFSVTRQGAL